MVVRKTNNTKEKKYETKRTSKKLLTTGLMIPMTPDARNRRRSMQRNCDNHNDTRILAAICKSGKQLRHWDVQSSYNRAQDQPSALHGKALWPVVGLQQLFREYRGLKQTDAMSNDQAFARHFPAPYRLLQSIRLCIASLSCIESVASVLLCLDDVDMLQNAPPNQSPGIKQRHFRE